MQGCGLKCESKCRRLAPNEERPCHPSGASLSARVRSMCARGGHPRISGIFSDDPSVQRRGRAGGFQRSRPRSGGTPIDAGGKGAGGNDGKGNVDRSRIQERILGFFQPVAARSHGVSQYGRARPPSSHRSIWAELAGQQLAIIQPGTNKDQCGGFGDVGRRRGIGMGMVGRCRGG